MVAQQGPQNIPSSSKIRAPICEGGIVVQIGRNVLRSLRVLLRSTY
ncbi:Bgt-50928 [Blumeria graminis f. sp. tritici]|uniref:Bgt-50928 n=1 Tax=Blumeria graminis f. sp. tritici TaxID=62690 RepID=A0A9X9PRH6_BLUGR|nr:Bgt-50928 [Blumeria graminis f. sp. tritici]